MWFIVFCTLTENEYTSLLFSQTFSSYCFCMLSEFIANVFERKIWRVQVAHLHNAAYAFSSPSRCFQLSTNLHNDFFRYLCHCGKKKNTNRMWFSVVCTLIDNSMRHHSCQNLLWNHSAAPRESTTFWPLWWRMSLQTTLNHFRFVKYLINWIP